MALNKAKSRAIMVGDAGYRWVLSDLGDVDLLTVQAASGIGCKLVVSLLPKHVRGADGIHHRESGVTPALVASAIEHGRAVGWRPDESGAEFRLHLRNGAFVKYVSS